MKTLTDDVLDKLSGRDIEPLLSLLQSYESEKDPAKCYSTLAYLACSGAGGDRQLAQIIARMIEAFFLATSIHDDAVDCEDQRLKQQGRRYTINHYMVLGDCFFVQLGMALAEATPLITSANRELVRRRLEQYLFDVAQAQILDERTRGRIPTEEEALAQMRIRGGTWGRVCIEVPALAGGLPDNDAAKLGAAGENMFLAMTLRDDLRDLRDDLANGVYTLAPARLLNNSARPTALDADRETTALDATQTDALIGLLYDEGVIASSLLTTRQFAAAGMRQLEGFLSDRDDMNWYLLQMLFRLLDRRFAEFTPDDVRQGNLGIGFSPDEDDSVGPLLPPTACDERLRST